VNLDFTVHYNYAREYVASMQAGDPWPRWAFLAQEGNGEPGLLYYSPLYYMATWLFFQLTHNVWLAMQCVEIAAAGVLGYFAWLLSAQWHARRWAVAAIPLAVLSPMLCLMHLGFNGYPWACAIAPLGALVWALLRPAARDRPINIPAIVALAATVMTHTVTGLMAVIAVAALPAAVLFEHWTAGQRGLVLLRRAGVWAPIVTICGGLLLSAVYLLPAFASQDLIDAAVWRENYTPFDAFSLPTVTAWLFGMRWFAFQWPVSLVAIAMSAIAVVAIPRSASGADELWFVPRALVLLALVAFLSTELSYPLWLFDTPLRNVQFPHRFISILVPLAAVLTAVCLARTERRWVRGALALLALATIAMSAAIIAKAALRDGERLDISETRFDPYPGLDEYRTADAAARGIKDNSFRFGAECAARGVRCSAGERRGRSMRWTVVADHAARLRLPVYCFPAWAVTVDGITQPSSCDRDTALVSVRIPRGASQVAVAWRMLPLEKAGLTLSLLAALALAIARLLQRRVAIRRTPRPLPARPVTVS
jgi:hypothetical protein